ncbi:MAG TPA: hypothetical protein VGC59_10700 [Solirubrobacteraceae bacterium]|jgi:hypothetical protein
MSARLFTVATRPLWRVRRVRAVQLVAGAALVLCVAGGFALRAQAAQSPSGHRSADERAYGRIALALSTSGSYGDPEMRNPYQWAPGAPALFALAHRVGGGPVRPGFRFEAAYWAQAVVGTLAIAVAFGLAWLAAGGIAAPLVAGVAGVGAAAAVALYPPLVAAAGSELSEPLGALLLVAACAALAGAQRRRRTARLALCGALLGATALTRADLLLVPVLAAGIAAWRVPLRADVRGRLTAAAVVLVASVAVMAPWIVTASATKNRFVAVSDGGPSALYIGTFLPGGGTLVGLKRELAAEVRRRHPLMRRHPPFQIPARIVLRTVAERHPGVPERVALRREAQHNLRVYALGRPGPFLSMMAGKASRMWLMPTRSTLRVHGRDRTRGAVIHLVLLGAAVLGLAAGLWRRRNPALLLVAVVVVYSTLLNALLVAEARHNLPLLPALYAAGAAGWAIALTRRAPPATELDRLTAAPR